MTGASGANTAVPKVLPGPPVARPAKRNYLTVFLRTPPTFMGGK